MDQASARLQALSDEALPALPSMLSEEAVELLGAAIAPAPGRLVAAQAKQVHWQPGKALTVVYEARAARPDRKATRELLVASAGDLPTAATIVEKSEEKVAVWQAANDPRLPGLGVALDPARTRHLLDELDVAPGDAQVRLRSYRPGRRAVVELRAGSSRLFVKVVQPGQTKLLQSRHKAMSACLPVPHSHGWSGEFGLVVLEARSGATLRQVLDDAHSALPEPAQIAALLDRIPMVDEGREPPSPLDSVERHAELVGRLLPELKSRLNRLECDLLTNADEGCGPLVPVHGDFHEAQLVVSEGRITGLLDVDTAGLGRRIDDWATMLGHIALRAEAASPPMRTRIRDYGKRLLAIAQSQTDPVALRRRIAAVVLGLATGPFRVQSAAWPRETEERIVVAERWLASAESSRCVRRLSSASQV